MHDINNTNLSKEEILENVMNIIGKSLDKIYFMEHGHSDNFVDIYKLELDFIRKHISKELNK